MKKKKTQKIPRICYPSCKEEDNRRYRYLLIYAKDICILKDNMYQLHYIYEKEKPKTKEIGCLCRGQMGKGRKGEMGVEGSRDEAVETLPHVSFCSSLTLEVLHIPAKISKRLKPVRIWRELEREDGP